MAVTPAGAALTTAYRAQQLAVQARSVQGLLALWKAVDPTRLAETIDAFVQAAALLASQGFGQSAVLAGRYFELFRVAEGVAGAAAPVIARPGPIEAIAGDIRGAALKGIIDGRRAGMSVELASRNGLVRAVGTLSKHVLAGGRMTTIASANGDPVALGWSRVTSGDPCAFCRSLAARGPVYKSDKSADFRPHDHCGCVPEVVYRGTPTPSGVRRQQVGYRGEFKAAQEWARSSGTMSQGTSNDALNNYRRWLASGSPSSGQKTDAVAGGTDGGDPA
jgi:hypothetical protein